MVVTSIENNFKHGTQPDYVFLSNLYYVYLLTVHLRLEISNNCSDTDSASTITNVQYSSAEQKIPLVRVSPSTRCKSKRKKKMEGNICKRNELSSRSSLPVTEILTTLPRAGNRSCYYAQLHLPRIKSRDRTYVHRFRFSRATGFVNERLLEKGPERDYASVITDRRTNISSEVYVHLISSSLSSSSSTPRGVLKS